MSVCYGPRDCPEASGMQRLGPRAVSASPGDAQVPRDL